MKIQDSNIWSNQVFGGCDLGDPRRLARLIRYAGEQASAPDCSTSKVCRGDKAAEEASYRFLRNEHVKASAIDEGVFRHTAKSCEGIKTILAIQDTTTIDVRHDPLRQDLKERGCPTGWVVHSSLAVDGETGYLFGLLDQERWIRPTIRPGKKKRAERAYEEKESFKWQRSLDNIEKRVKDLPTVITVCDREADIYEFLYEHNVRKNRYVIRASFNRRTQNGTLFDEFENLPLLGFKKIVIGQRGESRQALQKPRPARKMREAELEIRAGEIEILSPMNHINNQSRKLKINTILVKEINNQSEDKSVLWRLFTSEEVNNFESVKKIISYYEKRWLIEEFHKCWKSGCLIEKRSLQSLETLERFYALSAPIAVRLLQLQQITDLEDSKTTCEEFLTEEEWECLSAHQATDKKVPKNAPSGRWAYYAIARLGGWSDSKRTGRVGWKTMWDGWNILSEMVRGWRLAKSAYKRAREDL
jgi:hypothetical protein